MYFDGWDELDLFVYCANFFCQAIIEEIPDAVSEYKEWFRVEKPL